ncbi:PAS domain S-box protein [Methanoregula sp.]|uniref:hybrid sensor histidine kinase/response regulator n=1 Tax=Methanoregula sp. TaxID=2052170 RepID=UPI00356925B2
MYSVLYVDDEPDLLNLARLFLEESGLFTVDIADSGASAQQKLNRQRYDAVVSDYQMPGMDGIVFLKYIRQHFGNVPFILFTGKGREEVVIEAINNGADYYLQKGGDPDSLFAELIHKLRQAIQRRKDQATIRMNEKRLRRAQEIGHTGSWEYSIANQTIWGSDEGFRIFGINSPAGEVPVGQVEACIQQAEVSRKALYDLIHLGKEYNIVYTINPADGSPPRNVRSIAELEKDGQGNPVKVLGIIRDITEQTKTRSALVESEGKYRSLVEHSFQGVAISRGTQVLYANRTLLEMYGYDSFEEFEKIPVLDHLTRESRIRSIDLMKRFARGETLESELVQDIIRKDGAVRTLSFNVTPVEFNGEKCEQLTFLDITGRKEAQEALFRSEHRFRDIYENAPVGIFRSTLAGRFIHANPALARMLGFDSPGDLMSRVNDSGIPESIWEEASGRPDFIRDVLKQKGWHSSEHRFRRNDGQIIIVNLLYRSVLNYQSGELELEGFCADISDHKKAVEALMESETRFKDVTRNTGEWIWEVDADGIYRYSSPAGKTIHGYDAEELVGKMHFYDLFVPEMREDLKQQALGAFRQKTGFRHFINVNLRKDGGIVILETSGTPILDDEGALLGYRGTDLDITSRKKAEDELVKNEAMFRQLVQQLQDSVIIISYGGTILFGNPSAYNLVGYPVSDTIIETDLSRFVDKATFEQVMSDLKDIAAGNPLRVAEYRIITAANTSRWVEASGTRINYQGKDAIMVAIRDVTERRHAREELVMINKKLELLSSITRHDIINKVTVILGNLRTARKTMSEPEIVALLDKLESAAKSIRSQTEFTRIYQILGSHEPRWQSINDILPVKSIPPEIHAEFPTAKIEIFADPMLEKVFYNLLDNSIKHGGHVTEIRLFPELVPEGIRIIWQDNGSGIPAGDKEYIFERGFGNNSGLGLFLSREILAITGIGIKETGTFLNGARFEITIPADHARIHE